MVPLDEIFIKNFPLRVKGKNQIKQLVLTRDFGLGRFFNFGFGSVNRL
jgi:hypothetical protein